MIDEKVEHRGYEPNESQGENFLGLTLTLGQERYRLEKVLGGGATATAVVFLGVNPDNPADEARHAAIKVSKDEERWRQALTKEWRNLCSLAEAEKPKGTHYFPRVLFPTQESDLVYPIKEGVTRLVLTQEFVSGIGVHDLLLDYPPDLRLPEPLALEIACQYADMLTILHDTNLTCADRKLADLHWQKEYDFKQGDREALTRWQGSPPGHLTVLDWNVTEVASPGPHGTIALDLFRFGILWHRMLLGVEPRFRRGAGWQLEEPLEKNPIWPQLSFGTRQILSRLLHPLPAQRYLSASDFLKDVKHEADLWQTESQVLEEKFKSVYNDVANLKFVERGRVEEALRAADVLRLRVEAWGEHKPTDFDNIHRALWRAVVEAPFGPMKEALYKSQWDKTLEQIKRLEEEYAYNPAQVLRLGWLRQIVDLSYKTERRWEKIRTLWAASEQMFALEASANGEKPEFSLEDVEKSLQEAMKQEENPEWKKVIEELLNEAEYRLCLIKARQMETMGNIKEASRLFETTADARKALPPNVIESLDYLYGDPTKEMKEASERMNSLDLTENLLDLAATKLRIPFDSAMDSDLSQLQKQIALVLRFSSEPENRQNLQVLQVLTALRQEISKSLRENLLVPPCLSLMRCSLYLSQLLASEETDKQLRSIVTSFLEMTRVELTLTISQALGDPNNLPRCLEAVRMIITIFPDEELKQHYEKVSQQPKPPQEAIETLRLKLEESLPVQVLSDKPTITIGTQIKANQGEITRLNKEINELNQQLQERETLGEKARKEITTLEAKIADQDGTINSLTAKVSSTEEENSRLRKQIENLREKIKTGEAALRQSVERISQLSAFLGQVSQDQVLKELKKLLK